MAEVPGEKDDGYAYRPPKLGLPLENYGGRDTDVGYRSPGVRTQRTTAACQRKSYPLKN